MAPPRPSVPAAPPRRHRRRPGVRGRLLLSAALLVPSVLARADDLADYFPVTLPGYGVERGVTVLSRAHPDYDPPGVQVDNIDLVLHPAFEQSLGFDSNPAPGVGGSRASAVEITHPSLALGTEDDRTKLGAYFDIHDTRFLDDGREDRTDYTLAAGATVEIGRGTLTIGIAHLGLHQDRTQVGALATDAPIAIQLDDARIAYTLRREPMTVTIDLNVQDYRFAATTIQGVPVPQSYRNRVVTEGGGTVRYDLADQRSLLFVLRGVDAAYLNDQIGQPSRDSRSVVLLGGLDYDDDGVWRFRVLLGLEARTYAARQYGTQVAPVAEADVIWNPDGLDTVTARLSRTIEDAAQEGIAGYTYTTARLVWDHEYLRNVFLQARLGVQVAEFQQHGGTQTAESGGLGVTWLVTRWLRASLTYDHTSQQGGPPGFLGTVGSYGRDVVLLAARLAF